MRRRRRCSSVASVPPVATTAGQPPQLQRTAAAIVRPLQSLYGRGGARCTACAAKCSNALTAMSAFHFIRATVHATDRKLALQPL